MELGQKLKAVRKAEGLTQKSFCEACGLALGTVKNYEGDINHLDYKWLCR